MIKEIILLISFVLITQTTVIGLTENSGQMVPFFDYKDPLFQKVLSAVIADHPQVSGWHPNNATKQVVNGLLYRFYLFSDEGEIAYTEVWITSQQVITIRTFSIIAFKSAGSFKPFNDYSNVSFQEALNQAKWQNYQLLVNNRLNKTQLFVSKRFYYFKFYFINRQQSKNITQVVQCISFETPAVPIPIPQFVGSMIYNDPNVLRDNYLPYNSIINYDPSLSVYKISTIMRNPSLQYETYIFVLENSIGGFQRRKYYVSEHEDKSLTVKSGSIDNSLGYSQRVIDQVEAFATRTWDQLDLFMLEKVENIYPDKSGLRLVFENDNTRKYVELDLQGSGEILILKDA